MSDFEFISIIVSFILIVTGLITFKLCLFMEIPNASFFKVFMLMLVNVISVSCIGFLIGLTDSLYYRFFLVIPIGSMIVAINLIAKGRGRGR